MKNALSGSSLSHITAPQGLPALPSVTFDNFFYPATTSFHFMDFLKMRLRQRMLFFLNKTYSTRK